MDRREFLAWLTVLGLAETVRAQPDFRELSERLCALNLEGQPLERVRTTLGWTPATPEVDLLLAWYTGYHADRPLLEHPLAWKALGFAQPPTVCGGAWWDPPDE